MKYLFVASLVFSSLALGGADNRWENLDENDLCAILGLRDTPPNGSDYGWVDAPRVDLEHQYLVINAVLRGYEKTSEDCKIIHL
jgi:hypothetical protein